MPSESGPRRCLPISQFCNICECKPIFEGVTIVGNFREFRKFRRRKGHEGVFARVKREMVVSADPIYADGERSIFGRHEEFHGDEYSPFLSSSTCHFWLSGSCFMHKCGRCGFINQQFRVVACISFSMVPVFFAPFHCSLDRMLSLELFWVFSSSGSPPPAFRLVKCCELKFKIMLLCMTHSSGGDPLEWYFILSNVKEIKKNNWIVRLKQTNKQKTLRDAIFNARHDRY